MEVFGSNYGLLRTSNLRSARLPRQSPNMRDKKQKGRIPHRESGPLLELLSNGCD